MAKLKLVMTKGLPASGKSTYAKMLTEGGYYRVNKDDIREMLFGEHYKRKHEKQVIWTRDALIREALGHNKSVVVDDTNFNPAHERTLRKIAAEFNAEFEVNDSFLKVSIEECVRRDLKRPKSVGEHVIRGMYNQWLAPDTNNDNYYDPNLPFVVICDIDGTLAHMNGKRGPFDWHKVGLDDVDLAVAHTLDAYKGMPLMTNLDSNEYDTRLSKIILFSGRDEVCRPETEAWLEHYCISYDELYMRRSNHVDEHGNQVKDTLVKKEMYDKYIKGKYNVLVVIDDRPSVCRMWRDELGLKVLQAGDPHYEF